MLLSKNLVGRKEGSHLTCGEMKCLDTVACPCLLDCTGPEPLSEKPGIFGAEL